LSFFFYAIFRFVATHCYTPVILYVYFFKNNFLFFFLPVDRLYLYVYMCFFFLWVYFYLYAMTCCLSYFWYCCNDIDLCMYVAVQQWSTKLLFLFFLFNIANNRNKKNKNKRIYFVSFKCDKLFYFLSPLCSFSFVFFQSTLQTSSFSFCTIDHINRMCLCGRVSFRNFILLLLYQRKKSTKKKTKYY